MVARDEDDPSTDIVGQWAGEDLEWKLIEGLDQLRARNTLRVDLGCEPPLVFRLLNFLRKHEAVRHVDDDLARPILQHRADVLESDRSDREEDDIGFNGLRYRGRRDARPDFRGDLGKRFGSARVGYEDGDVLGGEE